MDVVMATTVGDKNWKSFFDLIIPDARKALFFKTNSPFHN
jgi:hypothetical protein